ncbi:MAG: hypothetical protein ACHQ53_05560 [Polyangiales bacterium]
MALILVLVWAGGAQARREQAFAYPFSRVWTAAVRMLRVDYESPITEKDKDSGYFLFDYPESGKKHPGSVEVVRVQNGDLESVRVVIQLPAMPSYVEQMMLDRLSRKLGQDYGQPAHKPESGPQEGADDKALKDTSPPPPAAEPAPKADAKPGPQSARTATP